MKISKTPFALAILVVAMHASAAPIAEDTCGSGEKWIFGPTVPADFARSFEALVAGKLKPVQAFGEALALRKQARDIETKLLAEYWISRALFDAKLVHIAHGGFSSIASRPVTAQTAGVQLAAANCLLAIQARYPTLQLPSSIEPLLGKYAENAPNAATKQVAWEAAGSLFRARLETERSDDAIQRILSTFEGDVNASGAHGQLARGLWQAKRGNHPEVIAQLEQFLAHPSLPQRLNRFRDPARILLARSLYTIGQHERAGARLKQVSKASNELAHTLSELAWAQLMAEKYGEAIGTATNLQAGGLRKTFAPESLMVMAMAMNELCQYPQSVAAIRSFQRRYDGPHRWLLERKGFSGLYPEAVAFLAEKSGSSQTKLKAQPRIPVQIASEWVRSPLFISHQDEINLLFDERDSSGALGRAGADEQRRQATALLAHIRDLKPRLQIAKMKQKPGEALPKKIIDDLDKLRDMAIHYRRLQQAAPVWRIVLANQVKQVPQREKKIIADINDDLELRSHRMLRQLDEIAENIQLIEVEIYNGASQDIIWQNAHPDYKQMAEKLSQESEDLQNTVAGKRTREKTWDWGRSPASADDDEAGEIWEDELGSFKANLFDNCSSKDRYLALGIGKKRSSQ